MSLNISYKSEGTENFLGSDVPSSDLFDGGKVTFKEKKGNPQFKHLKDKDSIVGVIHPTYLSVYAVNGKKIEDVICLPKELTLEFALHYISKYGRELGEYFIKTDSKQCLLLNIMYHFGSFEAVNEKICTAVNIVDPTGRSL